MFVWDPPTTLFTLPYLNLDVRIYGLLFALGFLAGYYVMVSVFTKIFNNKEQAQKLTDKLVTFSIIGCILGARLGHVLFYDLDYYYEYPNRIFAVWEGGLASHGGAIGLLFAILAFRRTNLPKMSFVRFLDLFVVPVACVAFFIRIGNFFNQEILGNATDMPWGILFPHAVDGGNDFYRHPVQLYEGLFYLATFFLLKQLSKKQRPEGFIAGLFLILVFSSRFIFEFFKSTQGGIFDGWILQTGQILSLPFIVWGAILIQQSRQKPIEKSYIS